MDHVPLDLHYSSDDPWVGSRSGRCTRDTKGPCESCSSTTPVAARRIAEAAGVLVFERRTLPVRQRLWARLMTRRQ